MLVVLSSREFKITILNVLKDVLEKVNKMQGWAM